MCQAPCLVLTYPPPPPGGSQGYPGVQHSNVAWPTSDQVAEEHQCSTSSPASPVLQRACCSSYLQHHDLGALPRLQIHAKGFQQPKSPSHQVSLSGSNVPLRCLQRLGNAISPRRHPNCCTALSMIAGSSVEREICEERTVFSFKMS